MFKEVVYIGKRYYHWLKTGFLKGHIAQLKHRYPSKKLAILAITGTDGKTSSSTLLYHVLKNAGKKVALVSTVGAYKGDKQVDTGFHVTSPDPATLHAFLAQCVEEGYTHVVLEATSHGLYQHRLWGIQPLIAGYTNITHEHLDYHLDYHRYVEAKALLAKKAKLAVINDDDESAVHLKKMLTDVPTITYSLKDTMPSAVSKSIKATFPEEYNQSNARLVWTMASKLGIEPQQFSKALDSFPGVPGRMEVVVEKPYTVIVDFAHTPNALEKALVALRQRLKSQKKAGRLIAVYGCAGLRDHYKRPKMGEIGTRLADLCIFTAEDPRTENIWSIIRQMKEQLTKNHNKVVSIADRKQAIDYALHEMAKPGDIIGIFGKGHEQSLCYGTVEYPWDDRQVVRELSKQKG